MGKNGTQEDLTTRLAKLKDALQERQVSKKTLQKQKEELECELTAIGAEVREKYGIEPEKLTEALEALGTDIESTVSKLETKLGLAKE